MVTNIKLGPEGGPFVELDEDTGDFIIRVPNDSVDFDLSDLSNISNLIANSAEIDGNASPYAQDPHDVGGAQHAADTLANLNSKVSDATLDDANDTREPETHSGTHESGGTDEVNVAGLTGELADPQPSQTQDSGTDVVASPTLNFGSNVTVSDDAGTAKVDVDLSSVGSNAPDWEEDGNSPKTATTSASVSYSLASAYDYVMVFVKAIPNDTSNKYSVQVRFNGDSGNNYDYTDFSGNLVSDSDDILAKSATETPGEVRAQAVIDGRWGGAATYHSIGTQGRSNTANIATNNNVTSPLTTLDFLDPLDRSADWSIEVYGRDIA